MKMMSRMGIVILLSAAVICWADDIQWQVTSGYGNWNEASNWLPAQLPGVNDKAIIGAAGECIVNSNVGSVFRVDIGAPSMAVLSIEEGADLSVTGDYILVAGNSGYGRVEISGGQLTASKGIKVGLHQGGVVNQTGGTCSITNNGSLMIGGQGETKTGYYNISGGTLEIRGSTPTGVGYIKLGNGIAQASGYSELNISGDGVVALKEGSRLYLGDDGRADAPSLTLAVVNQTGGSLTTEAGEISLGRLVKAKGIYNLAGGTLSMNGHNLYIGGDGIGEFNMSGGTLNVGSERNVILARNAGSEGSLTISGGHFSCDNYLQVAAGSRGTITVIGSAASIQVGYRLDMKNKVDAVLNFVMDNNGVSTIECGNLAMLQGATINFDVTDDYNGTLTEASFDVITATNIEMDANTTFNNLDDVFTFSHEIVDLGDGVKALRLTANEPILNTCEDVKRTHLMSIADLNEDCRVDFLDLAIMARNWLSCNDPQDLNCL